MPRLESKRRACTISASSFQREGAATSVIRVVLEPRYQMDFRKRSPISTADVCRDTRPELCSWHTTKD